MGRWTCLAWYGFGDDGFLLLSNTKNERIGVKMETTKEFSKNKYLESVAYFEKLFDFCNKKFFQGELPAVVVTIQEDKRNKAYGWFTCQEVWKEVNAKTGLYEINLSAQFLNRPFEEVSATLLHELCHFYAKIHKLQDCSRSGTYHNKLFRRIAENHGLKVECEKTIGYSRTSLTPESKELLSKFLDENPYPNFYRLFIGKGKVLRQSSTRKYECPLCLCSCRATKDLRLICADCNVLMTLVE